MLLKLPSYAHIFSNILLNVIEEEKKHYIVLSEYFLTAIEYLDNIVMGKIYSLYLFLVFNCSHNICHFGNFITCSPTANKIHNSIHNLVGVQM